MEKLDSEMNRFHSQKVVQATDGLEKGSCITINPLRDRVKIFLIFFLIFAPHRLSYYRA